VRINVYVIDLEVPPRAKRVALRVGIPAAVVGLSAIAYASVPVTWTAGQALKSADLNSNFSNLDSRVTTLEGAGHVMTAATTPAGNAGEIAISSTANSLSYTYPVTSFAVGASSHCLIISTTFLCTSPLNSAAVSPPANSQGQVAYRVSGGTDTLGGFACYWPAVVNSTCSSCDTSFVVPVTANGTYDFGCAFFNGGGGASNLGAFCNVAVSCF